MNRRVLSLTPLLLATSALGALPVHALIGGQTVEPGEYASQLSLQVPIEEDTPAPEQRYIHHCSGSRIAEEWILAAAHCIGPDIHSGSRLRLRAGADLESPTLASDTLVRAAHVAMEAPGGALHDLGLVRVDASALGAVPAAGLSYEFAGYAAQVFLTGYGCQSSEGSSPSLRLKAGRVRISGVNGADLLLPADPFGGFFPTLCLGDSGGGMFIRGSEGGPLLLAGVNSAISLLASDRNVGNSRVARLDAASGFDAEAWIRSVISPAQEN